MNIPTITQLRPFSQLSKKERTTIHEELTNLVSELRKNPGTGAIIHGVMVSFDDLTRKFTLISHEGTSEYPLDSFAEFEVVRAIYDVISETLTYDRVKEINELAEDPETQWSQGDSMSREIGDVNLTIGGVNFLLDRDIEPNNLIFIIDGTQYRVVVPTSDKWGLTYAINILKSEANRERNETYNKLVDEIVDAYANRNLEDTTISEFFTYGDYTLHFGSADNVLILQDTKRNKLKLYNNFNYGVLYYVADEIVSRTLGASSDN